MVDDGSKRESDRENVAQLLELELIQKRAAWQQAKARRGSWLALSLLFLFLVLIAAGAAFVWFVSSGRVHELHDSRQNTEVSPAESQK